MMFDEDVYANTQLYRQDSSGYPSLEKSSAATPLFRTPFYHLQLHNLNTREALDFCRQCFSTDRPATLYFVNAHCFNVSRVDPEYLQSIEECDLVLNDGLGIKLASKLINVELKENMNGTDFIPKLLALAATEDKRVYLLGAKSGIAAKAKGKLEQQFDGLDVCGTSSGYFTAEEEPGIIERINASRAEIVVVGMGVPLQEKWISRNKDKFTHAKIIVAGGAIIDFSAGCVTRAPVFMRAIGLEWLFRFAQEPRRLFNRYFIGNWKFFQHILYMRLRFDK